MIPSGAPRSAGRLGDYDLLDKIGEGGMCEVFRARRGPTGDLVAVKILPARTARNEVILRRFEQEFRSAHRLAHPNIVRVLEFHGTHDTPFLVMELVEGPSLGAVVEQRGRLPEEEAIDIVVQVCHGLHYVHEHGLIHRDIKPDNILLASDGVAKITDLGLVKELLDDQDLTRTGRGLGTPAYMAPEQFRSAKFAGVPADVYALGATLYTLVTGRLPFGDGSSPLQTWMKKKEGRLETPRSLVPTLSAQTDAVIRRCLANDPAQRPASCLELARALTEKTYTEDRPSPTATPMPDLKLPITPPSPADSSLGPLAWVAFGLLAVISALVSHWLWFH
jgi:serine/threonine protein kinase